MAAGTAPRSGSPRLVLVAAGGAWWPAAAYLIVLGLLSLITIATGPETRGTAIAAGQTNLIVKGANA